MAIAPEEIVFVLSGGTSNTEIDDSLGGEPSFQVIPSGLLNNLFSDVSEEQNLTGLLDYRCFYVFNDNEDEDTLFETEIFIREQTEGGADIEIGTILQDEVQQITLNGTVSSGFFTISFDNFALDIEHPGLGTPEEDVADLWASDFQNKLRSLSVLTDVTVTGTSSFDFESIVFEVNFRGRDGKRSQDLIRVTDITGLVSPLDTTIQTRSNRIIAGSPINAVSPSISTFTTAPTGVLFGFPTREFPIPIGDLRVNDGFFMWARRDTLANVSGIENDGAILGLTGSIVPSRDLKIPDGVPVTFDIESIEIDLSNSILETNEGVFFDALPQVAASKGTPGISNGLSTVISGTINSFITETTMQFTGANLDAAISGAWHPNTALDDVAQDADIGMYFTSPDGSSLFAFRDLIWSMTMPEQFLSGSDPRNRTFIVNRQTYDVEQGVSYEKNLTGSLIPDGFVNMEGILASNKAFVGSLEVIGSTDLRLTIPIDLDFIVPLPETISMLADVPTVDRIVFRVQANIQARANAIIPLPPIGLAPVKRPIVGGTMLLSGSTEAAIFSQSFTYSGTGGMKILPVPKFFFTGEGNILLASIAEINASFPINYSHNPIDTEITLLGHHAISFNTTIDGNLSINGSAGIVRNSVIYSGSGEIDLSVNGISLNTEDYIFIANVVEFIPKEDIDVIFDFYTFTGSGSVTASGDVDTKLKFAIYSYVNDDGSIGISGKAVIQSLLKYESTDGPIIVNGKADADPFNAFHHTTTDGLLVIDGNTDSVTPFIHYIGTGNVLFTGSYATHFSYIADFSTESTVLNGNFETGGL